MGIPELSWMGKRILVVDDQAVNLLLLTEILKDDFQVLVAKNGEQALRRARSSSRPDLILLDRMMPGLDGLEVCRQLKQDPYTRDIPVIFVTGRDQPAEEALGFDAGAVDYITKPVIPQVVLARVRAHLGSKLGQDLLRDQNHVLERMVEERMQQLCLLQEISIYSLASLAEMRDPETGSHIRRTQTYVRILAESARDSTRYAGVLDDAMIERLYRSAPLHDVGKVAISDTILLKPGPLTEEEREIIKSHTVVGRDTLLAAVRAYGKEPTDFLQTAIEIAYSHHERWDGTGYPEGLAGEAIPLSARIMSIADVYDALVSRRVYKPAVPHAQAVRILREEKGKQFDPELIEAFLRAEQSFHAVLLEFPDSSTDEARPGEQAHSASA